MSPENKVSRFRLPKWRFRSANDPADVWLQIAYHPILSRLRRQPGGSGQEAINRPYRSAGMFGNRCETRCAMRRRFPVRRCRDSIAVTTFSSEQRPIAAAYSARRNTGLELKKDPEMSLGMAVRVDISLKSIIKIYCNWSARHHPDPCG